jgi:hypothetical protein
MTVAVDAIYIPRRTLSHPVVVLGIPFIIKTYSGPHWFPAFVVNQHGAIENVKLDELIWFEDVVVYGMTTVFDVELCT